MKCISMTLAAAAVALFASTASAQSARPITIGISAGAAIPVGDFADAFNTGYNGTLSLGLNSVGTPLGLRIDGMYNKLPGRDDLINSQADSRIISANANLVYALSGRGIRPYLIGGGGVYNLKLEGSSNDATEAGVNGGIGAAFPLSGFNTFIEARFHHVFSEVRATQFVPVTFGISF